MNHVLFDIVFLAWIVEKQTHISLNLSSATSPTWLPPTRHLWPMLGRENKPVGKTRKDLHQREEGGERGRSKQAPTLSGPPEPYRGTG